MAKQTRRGFLRNSLALGCSAAASPFMTPVTFADVASDNRLVVIILRGAMDGLDIVRPQADKLLKHYRTDMDFTANLDLGTGFALHPELSDLAPMWAAGELGFVHAVSTPYRDKRSHFDGQDLLEAGYGTLGQVGASSGWLNRLLSQIDGTRTYSAFAVGQENLLLLKGTRQFSNWVPGGRFDLSEQARDLLGRLYEQDDLFHASADIAMDLTSAIDMEKLASMSDEDPMDNMMDNMMGDIQKTANRANRAAVLAKFTAERLNEQTRIAAFSIGGWDTHRSQQRNIKRPSAELVDALNVLKQVLGRNWEKTAVVCMTEFGRTVRQNGSAGTDHGTGGAMVLAGGAIRGGQIYGDWPGLGETALYKGRDLMPTGDVREYAAHAIQGLFGTSDTVLENTVFPGLKLTKRPQIVL